MDWLMDRNPVHDYERRVASIGSTAARMQPNAEVTGAAPINGERSDDF